MKQSFFQSPTNRGAENVRMTHTRMPFLVGRAFVLYDLHRYPVKKQYWLLHEWGNTASGGSTEEPRQAIWKEENWGQIPVLTNQLQEPGLARSTSAAQASQGKPGATTQGYLTRHINAIHLLLTDNQVYFDGSEIRANIKSLTLATLQGKTDQVSYKLPLLLRTRWLCEAQSLPRILSSGLRGEMSFMLAVWCGLRLCRKTLLTMEIKPFCGHKSWGEKRNTGKRTWIWNRYKNNKWVIYSFPFVYWKTLGLVLTQCGSWILFL